jgi:cell fate (sporulation/competence/biofilm development) regulator YlbF (YheA/YmcA/DUF963 family)
MKSAAHPNQLPAMTATATSEAAVLEAATTFAQAIQASAEWRELISAQKAAEADDGFARMVTRQNQLAGIQNRARGQGQGLDGKSLVEFIALRDQIQRHELYVRQQEAGSAVVRLLQRLNEIVSQELGLDFASNAALRRGGCCG